MASEFHVLNLGAGVQSSTLALMSHRGDVRRFDTAIFSDTGEEPVAVYDHLQWLKDTLSFPIVVRSAGTLGDDLINGGSRRSSGTIGFASIPAFTSNGDGRREGVLRRQCTKEYKTEVIERTIRREILGLQKGGRVPKDVVVHQYLGLSYDEPGRIIRVRGRFQELFWAEPHFPLFEMEMTRGACLSWLKKRYPDRVIPRSACVFCPYHSNAEWRAVKENPDDWARAVKIDEALRGDALAARNLHSKMYVHRSCVPLAEADLREPDERKGQEQFGFTQECEGMCGV
jgi:hypothetical protein